MYDNDDGKIHVNEINIGQVKNGYIMIIIDSMNVIKLNIIVIIIDTSCHQLDILSYKNSKYDSSGVILLSFGIQNHKNESGTHHWCINTRCIEDIHTQYYENSVIGFDHFGSKDFVYSFRNKVCYGMINNLSVNMYATKKYKEN